MARDSEMVMKAEIVTRGGVHNVCILLLITKAIVITALHRPTCGGSNPTCCIAVKAANEMKKREEGGEVGG